MTKQEFEALVARGPVLLDGAMGSNLLERGMPKGALSELWADRHPETVLELQAAYAAAGSRILYAPTFQAQPEALAQAGWTGDVGAAGLPGRIPWWRGIWPPWPDAWSPGTRRISTG